MTNTVKVELTMNLDDEDLQDFETAIARPEWRAYLLTFRAAWGDSAKFAVDAAVVQVEPEPEIKVEQTLELVLETETGSSTTTMALPEDSDLLVTVTEDDNALSVKVEAR